MCGSFSTFITARIVGGIGIGLASNLSPMYIAEISLAHMRGRFVSINQLTIVIGILLAQVTNLMIAQAVPKVDQIRLLTNDQTAAAIAADEKEFDLEAEKIAAAKVVDPQALEDVKKLFEEGGDDPRDFAVRTFSPVGSFTTDLDHFVGAHGAWDHRNSSCPTYSSRTQLSWATDGTRIEHRCRRRSQSSLRNPCFIREHQWPIAI